MATVYEINKGIGRSVEFKGIKAQYIIYLALGLILLLLLFAILYAVCHLKIYYCLGVVAVGGVGFVTTIQRLSRTYGENGLQKRMASAKLPKAVRSRSRRIFIQINQEDHAQK